MSGGVFAGARNIFEHDIFDPEPFTEREAWIWLIREAAWKSRSVRFGKVRCSIERGQLATSVRFMAEKWQWSKSRVHRFLGRIEADGMIKSGTAAGHSATLITICKYDEYQRVSLPEKDESGTAAGQQRDSSGTNKNTRENIKGIEEEPLRGPAALPAKSLDAEVFRFGVQVLGKNTRGVIANLRKACEYDDAYCLDLLRQAAEKHEPMAWVQGAIRSTKDRPYRNVLGTDAAPQIIESREDREWRKREAEIYRGVH